MLCGYPPFYGENDAEILEAVKRSVYDFESEEWENVSLECKELITKLLTRDPTRRYTAEQAINHIWIKTMAATSKGTIGTKVMHNMQAFQSLQKLKKAVIMYIATQTCEKEIAPLRELFVSLDKDGDGKLSVEEIQDAIKTIKSTINFKEVLESMDTDKSGYIDYTEFLSATLDREMYLTPERLAAAFSAFDKDKSGKISAKELRMMIGSDCEIQDEKIWLEMIKDADVDGDGEVSYEEFIKMMHNIKDGASMLAKVAGKK